MLNEISSPASARADGPTAPGPEPRPLRTPRLLLELEPGERFRGTYLLRQITGKKTRAGKDYLSLEIGDRSGFLPGKVWDAAPGLLASLRVDHVDVEGDIETYNDKRQCRIVHIEPASGEIDPLQFLPKTPLDVRTLFNRLAQIHRDIDNPYLRRLIKGFLGDEGFRRRFLLAPAARNHHHPYLGGLLEHVVSLSEACCRVADAYPALDRDMLIAGAFFHDIGKVEELTVTPRIEYSDRGRLVGHIVTGVLWIEEHARKIPGFPRATLDHLVHLVLSHHGTLEWGSPVRPLTKEAIALHALDNLDAQLWAFDRAVSEAKDNGTHWTEYQRMFGRQMFKGAEEPAPHGKPTPDTAGAAEASNTADQSTGARPRATRPTTARSS